MAKPPIVIDEQKGLVFNSEEELFAHFQKDIRILENEFFSRRDEKKDFSESELEKYEKNLEDTLEAPDEVWMFEIEGIEGDVYVFIKELSKGVYYIAFAYLTDGSPNFVYLHYATKDKSMLKAVRVGESLPIRDSSVPAGALEGDSLYEGDDLAKGLYDAMLLLRSDKDIPESDFFQHADLRELTVEAADEIWRSSDSLGNVLVTFIRESDEEGGPHYVVVTVEDEPSGSHSLLFSFPTTDSQLLDRYRHGENLQADEVVQESSH